MRVMIVFIIQHFACTINFGGLLICNYILLC